MGAIRGDLSVLSLSNLVQALVLDRSNGLLTLESGFDRRVLRISPSGIRLVRGSQRCHRLERMLRRIGRFTTPSDDFTIRGGIPSRGALARLVQEWMLEEICELFTWSRGTFTFQKFDPAEMMEDGPFVAYAADIDVTTIALEAARWADELPRIKAAIPDLRQVPVRLSNGDSLPKFSLDPEAVEDVFKLVDGGRPVIQILQQSIFPRYIVLQVLYALTIQGSIRMLASTAAMPASAAA